VPNRFTGRIRRGEIASIPDLKAEFKALAKLHHPDLAGAKGGEEDFPALRAEYEAALRDFDLHRFGLGRGSALRQAKAGGAARTGSEGLGGNPFVGSAPAWDRKAFYVALAALRKRGFPKLPRHEKERMRYEYRRYLVLALLVAWEEGHEALFRAFEASLLGKGEGQGGPEPGNVGAQAMDDRGGRALHLLDGLLDYHASGTELLRVGLELEFARFRSEPVSGAPERGGRLPAGGSREESLLGFLALLVTDAGLGPALLPGRT
jgi:hypothetical protein